MTEEEYLLNPNKCKSCKEIIPYNKRKRVRNKTFCKVQCFNIFDAIQRRMEYEKKTSYTYFKVEAFFRTFLNRYSDCECERGRVYVKI